MIWTTDMLENRREYKPGHWGLAKPVGVTLLDRIRGAWYVLRGMAVAVRWH